MKTNGGGCVCVSVHVWCVSSRCFGIDPAASSKLSGALPKFSRVSMKLGSSSEPEEPRLQWLHASFSQKHRHHSKDDLGVPLSD